MFLLIPISASLAVDGEVLIDFDIDNNSDVGSEGQVRQDPEQLKQQLEKAAFTHYLNSLGNYRAQQFSRNVERSAQEAVDLIESMKPWLRQVQELRFDYFETNNQIIPGIL